MRLLFFVYVTLLIIPWSVTAEGPAGLPQAWEAVKKPPELLAQAGGDFGGKKGLVPTAPAESTSQDRPSLVMALMYSALLPGMGEHYLERNDRAAPFWVAEGALWAALLGFELTGGWAKTDYLDQAGIAGAQVDGKPEEFFQAMMTYTNRDEYNLNVVYENRREDKRFPETDQWNWNWSDATAQHEYVVLRNRSDKAYRGAKTVAAVLILNRLLSLLDTAVLYRSRTDRPHLGMSMDPTTGELQLGLRVPF